MKTLAMLFLVALSVPATAQRLSLEDAIAIGLENNFSIRIARNSAEISRNGANFGTSVFLPTLDASGSGSIATTRQETNSPFSFGDGDTRSVGAQLALNWTLFDGFRMFADRSRYHRIAELGEAQARAEIELAVTDITRAYFALVQQQQLVAVLSRSTDISRIRLEKERVRKELGGSLAQLLTAEVAFNSDSLEWMEQSLAAEIARQELNLALGRDADTPCEVVSMIDLPLPLHSRDEMKLMSRERNASLAIARRNLDIAEEDISISRSSYLPRMNLFATYGYGDRLVTTTSDRFDGDVSTQSADAVIGLNLSLNLFNGFRNSTEYQNTYLQRENRRLQLLEMEQRVDADLRAQLLTLDMRIGAATLAERNLDAARRNLDLHVERFNSGAISSLEFRDIQLQYVRAEAASISARFLARVALLDVQRTIGDITI